MNDNDIIANGFNTVQIVSLFVGTVIPILTALITKSTAPSGVKAVTALALSAVAAFGTEFINHTDNFYWQGALLTTLLTFMVSVATYYGLWRPTNVAGASSPTARAITG